MKKIISLILSMSTHIYNEDEADELLLLIRDSFIPAFEVLNNTLKIKQQGIENN